MADPDSSVRRLRRSADDRLVFGVAGGLGEHLALDPVLVRVGFVILALVGGVGVVIYALLAVAMRPPPGESVRGPLVAGLAGLGAALVGILVLGLDAPLVLLLSGACGLIVILLVESALLGGGGGSEGVKVLLVLVGAALLAPAGFAAVGLGGVTVAGLTMAGVGAALVIAGALGGAGRWLIVPALAFASTATIASAAEIDLRGATGKRELSPRVLADLRPTYRHGMGAFTLDLRGVDFRADTALTVSAGASDLKVLVPRDVCVSTRADVTVGDADVFGQLVSGFENRIDDARRARAGRPLLRLDVRLSVGAVTVGYGAPDPRLRTATGLNPQTACAPL